VNWAERLYVDRAWRRPRVCAICTQSVHRRYCTAICDLPTYSSTRQDTSRYKPVDFISSRVWTFLVGAELAVQSQQRLWDDSTRHPQLQPALSSAGTDKWVLSWRLNEASDSSGNRRAVGSRFQVLRPYAAKLGWSVNVRVQAPGGPRRLQSETDDDRP